jgi:hypothetical protein
LFRTLLVGWAVLDLAERLELLAVPVALLRLAVMLPLAVVAVLLGIAERAALAEQEVLAKALVAAVLAAAAAAAAAIIIPLHLGLAVALEFLDKEPTDREAL